jgi:hypothetical protein
MREPFQFIFDTASVAVITLLISCSGGGGGAGTTAPAPLPPPSLSITPNPIVEYSTTDQTNVGLQVSMSVDKWPVGTTLYFQAISSIHGIGDIHYTSISNGTTGATVFLSLTFRNPWAIGEGVYTDTLTIKVSTDASGSNQIQNSPQVVPVTFNVAGPSVLSISPNAVTAGGPDFTVTVTGMNFSPRTSILWNMASIATTYVSPTMLTAQVPATQITNAGSANVSVVRTVVGSGGFTSNIFVLPIQTVASSPGSLSPGSASAGGAAFTISVTGTDFHPTTYLQWNTDLLTTTYVSPTMITAQVPATEIANVGSASLYVVNGWGTTNWFQFPITASALTLSTTKSIGTQFQNNQILASDTTTGEYKTRASAVINR